VTRKVCTITKPKSYSQFFLLHFSFRCCCCVPG